MMIGIIIATSPLWLPTAICTVVFHATKLPFVQRREDATFARYAGSAV